MTFWLYSFWKFSRPHTIIGTSLSILALYLIAVAFTNNWLSLTNLVGSWLACLSGNIYIVGLNQLEDINIDKINKPHLPLAAEEFSLKQGQLIVIITGILALVLATILGKWLLATVTISLIIGTAYSLPPIRLKRFPFLAALCIFTVRGIVVNLGLFLHFSQGTFLPASVIVLTLFILIFTVAIAIFKDVPDLEGDKQFKIQTFTLILGKESVLNITLGIITICYLGMIVAGLFYLSHVNSMFLISTHLVLLVLLWWRSQGLNLDEKKAIASFYQFIWKLFFLEYIIFPTACLIPTFF